eukprot:1094055-Pelagomonas_calceolata.AAC.2
MEVCQEVCTGCSDGSQIAMSLLAPALAWGTYIELGHRHDTEPWSSARRATARRRSSDRFLVAGVEKRCPLLVGVIEWLFP